MVNIVIKELRLCMANKNRKRLMLTLNTITLSRLDKILAVTGETYSEFVTRVVVEKATERKID